MQQTIFPEHRCIQGNKKLPSKVIYLHFHGPCIEHYWHFSSLRVYLATRKVDTGYKEICWVFLPPNYAKSILTVIKEADIFLL